MSIAIKFEDISKQYRLGLVSTRTISHDLNRWWQVSVRGKEDPYLKIGEVNNRATKGTSEYVWALRDINYEVEQGDVLGIIGKNGAGKSTLLKILSKVTAPTTGSIKARGRIASLLEVGTGFHGEMTGRENIFLNGAILGMSKQEINRKLDEIVDFSGVERYLDTPVKRYSSGMTVRLGFAVAAFLEPEILVVDEVLAVGDVEFQRKAIGKMQDVSKGEGRTVLFVSHNMASIMSLCNKGMLLFDGSILHTGDIESVVDKYLSVNEELLNVPLHQRKDRKGNGIAKFVACDTYVNGYDRCQIKVGQPSTLKIEIDSSLDIENITIMLSIYKKGILITSSNTSQVSTCKFSLKPGKNIFECTYSSFPFGTGKYTVNIRLWDKNQNDLDWIENATSFEIVEADIFNTGRFYKDSSSIVLLPHSWTTVAN